MITYDFRLTTGDLNVGTVYLPDEDALNIPVVVYCHGWGGRRQLWTPTQALCDNAMKAGIALVTFDFFGCGETGGDYKQMTHTRWKDNLSEIVSWVQSQSFSNNDKIGCYAFSSGSTVALRMAAEDQRLAFIISVGTCISTHFGMGSGGPARLLADNLDGLISGGTANIFGIDFGIEFFVDTISKAPIHSMYKIKCPVLFLQGTADNPFRCADAKMAYDLMTLDKSHGKTTYMPLEGGAHELDNMADEAMSIVFKWLMPVLQ
jgi:alpha-beta hydrolase superfamily lysophospholipase